MQGALISTAAQNKAREAFQNKAEQPEVWARPDEKTASPHPKAWKRQATGLTSRAVAEDNKKFRCGGAFLDYIHILYGNNIHILYGNKNSQQDHRLEVP